MSTPHTAAVFGVINSFGVLSAAVSQVAFGAVPRTNWDDAFLVSAALLAAGSVCWCLIDVRRLVFREAMTGKETA